MSSGLYGNIELIERWSPTVAAGSLNGFLQPFLAPCDLEIVGLMAQAGTAPGSTNTMTINNNNTPTSQTGVGAYTLWTATNVPSLIGTATKTFTTSLLPTLVDNFAYALNYPLPGAPTSATVGFKTAQATTTSSNAGAVQTPPTFSRYGMNALVAPDNTYTDYNGIVQPASIVHAGDVLLIVIGGVVGSAANLDVTVFANKQ